MNAAAVAYCREGRECTCLQQRKEVAREGGFIRGGIFALVLDFVMISRIRQEELDVLTLCCLREGIWMSSFEIQKVDDILKRLSALGFVASHFKANIRLLPYRPCLRHQLINSQFP